MAQLRPSVRSTVPFGHRTIKKDTSIFACTFLSIAETDSILYVQLLFISLWYPPIQNNNKQPLERGAFAQTFKILSFYYNYTLHFKK